MFLVNFFLDCDLFEEMIVLEEKFFVANGFGRYEDERRLGSALDGADSMVSIESDHAYIFYLIFHYF